MSEPLLEHGLLLIDKESGATSHDVVQRVRRLLRQKKVGHCGTLDPSATGLLVLTVGRATRLTRFLIRAPKVYQGVMRLGRATDTYDAEGRVTAEGSTAALTDDGIAAAMARFPGSYEQTPPPYSAKKVKGVKSYELARKGEEVVLEAKPVTVYEFEPRGALTDDTLEFRLACSSGTYARSLVHDLGQQLGCGAHLAELRRLTVGPFQLDDAATVDALADRLEEGGDPGAAWIPFDRIPLPFGSVDIDSQQESRLLHGQTVLIRDLEGEAGDWVKLANRRGHFVAVGSVVERIGDRKVGVVQPKIVFK